MSSVIDERALRELYLVPFELAVREGGALGLMTAYNRFNGGYCTEDEALLAGILRGEWGFEGFVVSDWFALGSTTGSPRAGLDLEMPGPGRIYGPALADAVRDGDVDEALLDAMVLRLLTVLDRIGALDDDPDTPERSEDRPEHRALAREAAAESFVLLRNEGVLPLDPARRSARSPSSARTPTARRSWAAARPSCARTTSSRRWRRCAKRSRTPRSATSAAATSTARRPSCARPWRIEFEDGRVAERDSGLLLFDAPTDGEIGPLHRPRAAHPGRDRAAHVHAPPGRARPAAGRRRGRARRIRGPATARGGHDRPGQRGDLGGSAADGGRAGRAASSRGRARAPSPRCRGPWSACAGRRPRT